MRLLRRSEGPAFEIRHHGMLRLQRAGGRWGLGGRSDRPARAFGRCVVDDGRPQPVRSGNWMFYLPRTHEKLFHARDGMVGCIHPARPVELGGDGSDAKYTAEEWRTALATPIQQRLAEIFVAALRLWKAGLAPRPRGFSFVQRLFREGEPLGQTMGMIQEDVGDLPRKPDGTTAEMLAAGVRPDKLEICTRQQKRGYIVDLCSVVGVQPLDAERDVAAVREWIAAVADARRHPGRDFLAEVDRPGPAGL